MQLEEIKGNCEFPAIPNGQSEHRASDLAAIRLQIELSLGLASPEQLPSPFIPHAGKWQHIPWPSAPTGMGTPTGGRVGFFKFY